MPTNALQIIKELKDFEWQTKFGWLAYTVGIFLISSIFTFTLQQIQIALNAYWLLGIFIAPQIIHLLAWLIKRNFFYDPKILTVAFAISIEDNSKNYYQEIKKRFREQITTYKLQNHIKIKDLPSDISFSNAIAAEKFIIKKGIRLLIWGNTIEGNVNNTPLTQFKIKFSYQYSVFNKDKRKKFINNIDIATQRKSWGVWKPNSFYHLIVVSGNIIEISLFTLGTCLATVPDIIYLLKSVDIFEKLDIILKERKEDANFPNLKFIKQKVRTFLCDLYIFLLIFYWGQYRNLNKAIEYAEKTIKIDENNFIAHQNMAIYQWLKGEKDIAKYHTKRAWHIKPGHPLPRFNKAFFFIYDRKFESGLKQYKKIKYVGDTNIVEVIEFIEKEFEKAQYNLGLLFAFGWLNFQYADKIRGVSQLQNFLLKSKNQDEYKILITEAEKILNNNNCS